MTDDEIIKIISQKQVGIINKESSMIDHLSEWNGGYIPDNESKTSNVQPQLPVGINPCGQVVFGPLPQVRTLGKDEINESMKVNFDTKTIIKESNTIHKKPCACDIKNLFAFGCKCGGI